MRLLTILSLTLQLVGVLSLLLAIRSSLRKAEAAALAEVLTLTSWLRQRRLFALVGWPGRVGEDVGRSTDVLLIPVRPSGCHLVVIRVVLLGRRLLGLAY